MAALVWFRRDLRIDDNPAWAAATAGHDDVTALFVIDPRLWDEGRSMRGALLLAHLHALDTRLAERGGRLKVRRGIPTEVLADEGAAVDEVHWNDDYSPYAIRRDDAVSATVAGIRRHAGLAVHAPGTLLTGAGEPYRVFTPFHRRWEATEWAAWPQPGGARVGADLGDGLPPLHGEPPMAGGEDAAAARLGAWLELADAYGEMRNRPDLDATSHLGADLKFGTLAARTVAEVVGDGSAGRVAFVRQLAWRDFYLQLLAHFPHTVRRSMRPEYDAVPWRDDPEGLAAWQEGRTGYPIVDAGMRQLRAEGWMHNRVRMITASFLVKDLLVDWRLGERHFRRLLLDGDVAQNVGNWQWVAGTGADAAPYFRIFNPVTQSRKFDPNGEYVRRYVPELAALDGKALHAPWEAGPLVLAAAGVTLGEDYPEPIVDHTVARERALDAYAASRALGT